MISSVLSNCTGLGRIALAAVFMVSSTCAVAQPACQAQSSAGYSPEQAERGKAIFESHCAVCHGATLAGAAGPPLAGEDFASYLDFSKITAAQLLHFIMTQMPYNAPGSLPKASYEAVFAYILSVNKYPAGEQSLNESNVACVKLLPHPE